MHYIFVCYLAFNVAGFSQPLSDNSQPRSGVENYLDYHRTVVRAQERIAHQDYQQALDLYQQVFDTYRFVFLKDYKVATQLALQLGKQADAFTYLKKAMAAGWTLNEVKKAKFLKQLQRNPDWKMVVKQRDSLESVYQTSGNRELRAIVKRMFKKDQRKALLALFTFSAKRQEVYAETKFAPHSEKQLAELSRIIRIYGYPGERLIHNRYWTSVILSHHNSISKAYNLNDSLYPAIRPRLLKGIETGELTPEEFVRIDDWYIASTRGGQEKHFGHLTSSLTRHELEKVNQLREEIGMISVETANTLIDLQAQTGMNFNFPSDLAKKIAIVE